MARRALPEKIDMAPEYQVAPDLQDNMNALAIHQRDIMEKYGEGLPYERERIVHESRFYMAQMLKPCWRRGND
ncbi:hypothetical protein CE195_11940 [Sodalis-like symbiont of Philaenus spumarius]|nr:hypothetical protein CE195_11940 [Sodalis-like symbiont of Philaenus spumarius]